MTTKTTPSDTVLVALLSTGIVLAIVGACYPRITAIKLPGGAEVDLTAEEKQDVAAKVGETLSAAGKQPPPTDVAKITAQALDTARLAKHDAGGLLDEKAKVTAAKLAVVSS